MSDYLPGFVPDSAEVQHAAEVDAQLPAHVRRRTLPAVSLEHSSSLGTLLSDVEGFLKRFVTFTTPHQAVAVALWVAHVYAIEAANTTPYLRLKSATPEAGKSTLLEVLYLLLGETRAELVANTSPAVLYRLLDESTVALLFDETDNTLARRKDDASRDLLGLINAGYRRGMTVMRMEGSRTFKVRRFKVFGPKALAGINDLADTIESRCIPVVLRREPSGGPEEFIYDDVAPAAFGLIDALTTWASDGELIAALRSSRPRYPAALRARQKEVWRPLLAIADAAGDPWDMRAREAAKALHGADTEADTSTELLLLLHARAAFEEAGTDRLSTHDLLRALVENEEGPWAQWWSPEDGKIQASASKLARKLKPFGVAPRVIRDPATGKTPRGYARSDFEPVWERYALAPPAPATPATGATP